LLKVFFAEFLGLLAPDLVSRLRVGGATFLDKEAFTDWPVGERREMDLLVEVPAPDEEKPLLIHIEIETEYRSGIDRRLWLYYMQLRLRHGLPVLPILVSLRGGPAGLRRAGLREGFAGKVTASFRYRVLGLSGCQAKEWLARPEPVAWAFAALMRPGAWSRAELKLECLRRIAASDVTGLRKQILVNWVETYVQLSEQDTAELRRLLDLAGNEEIKAMELTWLGKAEARGMEMGIETATRQAVERMRRVVVRQIEQRFGVVPATVQRKVEAIDGLEPLATLAERVLVVSSIDELEMN
jgi:hypothetical protein